MEAAKPLDLGWHLDVAWGEGVGGESNVGLRRTEKDRGVLRCAVVRSTAHMANGKAQRLSWKFKL